jgi:microcystin degradation protein MlrC
MINQAHKDMPRILLADLKQETSTFNPAPTPYDMFRIVRGTEIFNQFIDTRTELAGAIDVLRDSGDYACVPTMAADSVSGGAVPTDDLDRLLGELLATIRCESEIDGCLIVLHGAMAGESENDPEGYLLEKIREYVGDIPIVATIDLHAILTDRMLKNADIIVPYHTYPHVDQYETGMRAAHNLIALLSGDIQPELARIKIPMLVRGDELLTATGKFGEAIQMCQLIEESPGGLVAGVNIGNAFTDVPDLRTNVIVYRDADRATAETEATEIADFMWSNRESFKAKLMSLPDSIERATNVAGMTVFSDAADATASGASGDSNEIIKGILEHGFLGKVLVSVVDAPVVQRAVEVGVDGEFAMPIGGQLDPQRFTPVELPFEVVSLHDGQFQYENGMLGKAGTTAVLKSGSITLLVTSVAVYVVGQMVYTEHGLQPRDFDVVVVKSPNGFRPYYEDIAADIVAVDVAGSTSANLQSLPYKHCGRPMFPLDEDVEFSL